MKTFSVQVKETLVKVIKVKAETRTEALAKVKEQYQNEEIVLVPPDSLDADVEFYIL